MRKQFEAVHRQAQIGEPGLRRVVPVAGFQALGGAVKALAQGAVFVRVAQLAQQPANMVRLSPGAFHQRQGGGERDAAGLRVFEELALEGAALPRSIRVEPARAILAQGGTGLGKAGDGQLAAGKGNRQPECFQFPGIIARLKFHEIEERAVAAQSACAAKLFA